MSEAALPPLVAPPPRLSARRCRRHPARDAAARCVECGGDYCRECVSEHDGRLLCVTCLEKAAKGGEKDAPRSGGARRLLTAGVAALILWLLFYSLGIALVQTSIDGHGTLVHSLPDPAEDDDG